MAGLNKVTVEDINVKGRKVLVRVDFNVPMKDGVITNDNRIQAALPTINKLVENGAKVVLCSHLGKPKNGPEAKFSLAPAAERLAELVNTKVTFAADDTVVGDKAKAAVAAMKDGEIVVLENTRFRGAEETKNGEEFSKELADLVDDEVFVMDAFGSAHRAHASTAGVTKFVKETAVGYLMQKEIKYLGNAVEVPERPFVAILGGAKVADSEISIEYVDSDKIPADKMGLDIGPKTCAIFAEAAKSAKTVVWNGPMGVFENPTLKKGTVAVCEALAEADATTIIGGGDSATAAIQLGFADKMSHISTGGGASLEYLEGKVLPGVAAIADKK